MIRRREFIALGAASIIGSGAGFAPATWAQQAAGRKRVGVLFNGSISAANQAYIDALRAGLKEEGFFDGGNVTVEVRPGLNDSAVMRAAAREFAAGGYDVVVAAGTAPTTALVAETRTMPIVFASASDPIGSGFVQSFARPGGNITGFTNVEASWGGKWLEMLHEVAPGLRRAVLMSNPDTSVRVDFFLPSVRAAASALRIETAVVEVRTLAEIDAAISAMAKAPGAGLVATPDAFTLNNRRTVIEAVARENLPAIYTFPEFADDGGLIAYGSDNADGYRRSGGYAGLILNGARPSDLPVQAPTKFVLSVNLKTAKAQGITIPPNLLVLADKVIQ